MDAIRRYLLALSAAALLCGTAMTLLPKGGVRRMAELVCGLFMICAALGPLMKLDEASLARSIASFRLQAEEQRTGVELRNRELVSAIIKEKTETYILDKASDMGLALEAEVTMEEKEGSPYPRAVRLKGRASAQQKAALAAYIEENLAIPADRQEWCGD
jgi:hypothetical protein